MQQNGKVQYKCVACGLIQYSYLAINEWSKAVQAMARRGDLLAIKGAWQLCRTLLHISDANELQQIEHDLREKLFVLYITSEFERRIDFELLKSLLFQNERLQYGFIVVITWLALLRSIVSLICAFLFLNDYRTKTTDGI